MKKVGKLLVMLSLVAMAPSYAAKPSKPLAKKTSATANVKKARPVSDVKQSKIVDQSHLFKGLECTIVFVNSNYSGEPQNGEFCTPYTTLDQAAEAAPENAIIYVLAGEYRTNPYEYNYDYSENVSAVVVLKSGQKLIGSGCALRVGDVSVAALTERHPIIYVGPEETGVIVKNRNYVSGFEFIAEDPSSPVYEKASSKPELLNQCGISSLLRNRRFAQPETTGFVSGFAGGSCHISKNSFVNLQTAVDVVMAGWSNIDICSNKFVSKLPNTQGVVIGTNNGTSVSVTKNFFEGVCFDITVSGSSALYATLEQNEKEKTAICSTEMKTSDECSSVCMGSEICVESNVFKKPLIDAGRKGEEPSAGPIIEQRFLAHALLVSNGARTVSFRHNKVHHFKGPKPLACSANLSTLLSEIAVTGINISLGVGEPLIPGSFVDVSHNLFEHVEANGLSLRNAKATVKENEFVKCVVGLGIASAGNATAWVEKNRFCDNSCLGFAMLVGDFFTRPGDFFTLPIEPNRPIPINRIVDPSCLLLTDNEIEGHECLGTAYLLANLTTCPTLFKVAVQNPLNGRISLSKDNDDGLVIIQDASGSRNDNAVDFVRHCPGCGDSR